jgi:signal peptidase I
MRAHPDQERESANAIEKDSLKSLIRDLLETVLLALIIFAVVRFFVQNFRIEGHSMAPTLNDGQFLIVDKISYRFSRVERGDIIVFHAPRGPNKDFIKRVVGLPGEKIQIDRGLVLINDQPLSEPYISYPGVASWGPRILEQKELFVLGDNRPSSNDSRQWGPLPREDVVGKAWFCYWPPEAWGLIEHASYRLESGGL